MIRRHELSDAQWALIEPLLPPRATRGRYYRDHRTIVNGMLWILATGAPWRDLPERYGPWETIYSRFARWQREGLWARIVATLQEAVDDAGQLDWELPSTTPGSSTGSSGSSMAPVSAPTSTRRAREKNRRAWRRRTEPADHALGRSRGGFGTKLHLAVERGGRALNIVLSAGQAHESQFVAPVLDGIRVRQRSGRPRARPRRAALDRGYSTPRVRRALRQRHILATIPERSDQRRARQRRGGRAPRFEATDYRARAGVECCVGRYKESRRIATRYDKLAVRYLAFIHLAMILEYLRTLSNTP